MSFSGDVKRELAKIDEKKLCCLKAECYGIWLFSKCFTLDESAYISENPEVVRKMAELAAASVGVTAEMSFAMRKKDTPAYKITLPDEYSRKSLLNAFGHSGEELSLRINRANFEDDCCYAAFLRGVYLACGAATDPNKDYHLEFAAQYKNLSNDLYTLMRDVEETEILPLQSVRKGSYIVYFKDSQQIENLLVFMGANSQAMELMQIKMYKEAKNNINRRANFETANMDKTYSASARQIAAIARISDEMGIENLSDELRDVANLRLDNPEMTLKELADSLRLSRSTVNGRLNKILKIGEELAKSTNEDDIFMK